jgi:hypothetical protein
MFKRFIFDEYIKKIKMIKKILFFFLFSLNFYSQNKYEYLGALKLNGDDKTIISYRLVFTENKGKIAGYSLTDLGGNHETKNKISGVYNEKTKNLNFKEEDVLYTKSPLNEDVFCFVNFSGKVKLIDEKNKIEGEFKGFFKNKTKCIDGTITLIGAKKIYKLLEKINSKIQKSKKIDEVTKTKYNPVTILDSLKVNNLSKDQNLNVFVKSDKIQLEVWDSKVEDGDIIDLFQNGKRILNNYTVLNKKLVLNIKLESEKNVFRIEAISEGEMKPNTAMIQLIDDDRTYELSTNLKKGEKTSITIVKK